MSPTYLAILLVLLACMVVLDARLRLFFWRAPGRAAAVLAIGAGFLLLADLVGIATGVFGLAPTWAMTGVLLAPELPLEEPFFLIFLCYLTMNLVALVPIVRDALRGGADPRGGAEKRERHDGRQQGAHS